MGIITALRSLFLANPSPEQKPQQEVPGLSRRRLPDAPYLLPKDEEEHRRLNFQHHALYQLFKTHVLAPVLQPESVLDVGCGTGQWCCDVAKEYPYAQIVGIDKAEPFPTSVARPLNFRFTQCDILRGLPFPDRSFDYVHQRFMVLAIPAASWPFVIAELARVTKPLGYIELVEGGTEFYQAGPATEQLVQWGTELSKRRGIDATQMSSLGDWLREAGVRNVEARSFAVRLGKWGGREGDLFAKDIQAIFSSVREVVCSQMHVSLREYDQTVENLPKEWDRKKTQYIYYATYGQKQ
jgi:SAM-dependent methyltransferase